MSDKFDRMSKNAKQFGRDSQSAFKRASKGAMDFKSVMGGILAAGAVTQGLELLKSGIAATATEFIAFDDAITAASAKFKGLDLSTAEGQKTLEALGKTARKVGAETKFSATEAAQGLDFYATAGFNAEQAMKLLGPTANLAMAANVDLARASDIAGDSLNIFGLAVKDPIKLQENFVKMSDQMARTMTATNTTLEQMFEATKVGGGIFAASGQEMSTFNTFVRSLADSSIKGEKAGTGLKAFMAKLAKPTGEAAEALDALGVKTRDSQGNFRDAIDIIADFEKGMDGMGEAERLAAVKTIFGLETMTTFSALMKTGSENLRQFREETEESGGATQKMADIMNKSLGNQLASLKSAAIEVGFQFFEAFSGEGAGAIQAFTGFLREVDLTPFIEGVRQVAGQVKSAIEWFVEWGNKTGVFQSVSDLVLNTLVPTFEKLWGVAKNIFELLDNAGAFDAFGEGINFAIGILDTVFAKFGEFLDFIGEITRSPVALRVAFEDAKQSIIDAITAPFKAAFEFIKGIPIIGRFFSEKGAAMDNNFGKSVIADAKKMVATAFETTQGTPQTTSTAAETAAFWANREPTAPPRQAPNRVQVESRQTVDVGGRIDIAGAPAGSTATPSKGAQVDFNMMGDPRQAYYRQAG